ncbi:MAG: outer membrane beta-barrel domain-containing protein [Bradymonadales bacterium]
MKRLFSLLALIIVMGFGLPQISLAAEEEEGASSLEKGPPVRHLMLLRSGRFEIQPQAGFGVNQSFHRSIAFGGGLAYYFNNYLGLGANFVYAPFHLKTSELEKVAKDDYDDDVKLTLAVARPQMIFDVGLIYTPIMGKFSLFGWILNYDFHIYGGFGAIIMDSVCGAGGSECNPYKNASLEGIKFAGAIGLGVRLFFNNYLALNMEIRDYMSSYADYSRNQNDKRESFKNLVVGSFGFSIFLPISVYMSR